MLRPSPSVPPDRPSRCRATETPHPAKTSPDLTPTPDHIVPEVKDLTLSELLDRAQPQFQPQPKVAEVQPMSPVAGMGTDKALIHSVLSKYAAAKAPLKSEPEKDLEGESRAAPAPVSKADT